MAHETKWAVPYSISTGNNRFELKTYFCYALDEFGAKVKCEQAHPEALVSTPERLNMPLAIARLLYGVKSPANA